MTDPFIGEGEVQDLARSLDWSATSLGPVEDWPRTLREVVRACVASPFPMNLWCGPELALIYNDAYRPVLGSKHPESFGRPGPEVWAEIWDEIAPMFERIREGGPPIYEEDAEFVLQRAGEEEPEREANGAASGRRAPNAWFTFSLSPVRTEAGEIVAYLNVVSESTRRVMAERAQEGARAKAERAEARLREVFAQAPAFMAVLRGEDHVFEYVNSAYYQLVGHRELLGRPVFEALPEVRGQGFEALLSGVMTTGEPFVGREMPIMLAPTPGSEPEQRFLDFVYYPITEADGRRSGVVAHGSDVTEHVRARREAQRARAEAERANQAKSQFLATMSHEIRTPINGVIGYADLLDAGVGGALSQAQQGYVNGIRASSRHLLGLISDILDLAKIEAGELSVGAEEMPVRPAVASALRLVAPQADRNGVTLEESWQCDQGVRVRGDEDRIRQVLLNLLSNAVKFTDPGGVITMRCRVADAAPSETALPEVGPWVVLEVEDTGRGIPADKLPRVFDPFVQAETGHTRRSSGTGLGLTISRRLTRLMGGELTVWSEEGQGSRFSVWLTPATQERLAGATQPPLPEAWPPEPEDLPGLGTAGKTLLAGLERIEDEWIERVRRDRQIGAAARLNRAQLADQTAELIAAMAKIMFVLEEGGGDPMLQRDAEAVYALVARRHGHQRRRLGFGRAEVEREYALLGEVLDGALRREAPKRTAASLTNALGIVHRLVGRAASMSLASFDRRDGSAEEEGPEAARASD